MNKEVESNGLLEKMVFNLVGVVVINGVIVLVNGSIGIFEEEDVIVSFIWWDSIFWCYIIVGLCFVVFFFCNMDRVCGFYFFLYL